jgi:hypothetical protein
MRLRIEKARDPDILIIWIAPFIGGVDSATIVFIIEFPAK